MNESAPQGEILNHVGALSKQTGAAQMVNETIIREIMLEIEELEHSFAKRLKSLKRKLHLATGQLAPKPPTIEIDCPYTKKRFTVPAAPANNNPRHECASKKRRSMVR